MPETQHLRSRNKEGKPVNIIRQKEIKGKQLSELNDVEIYDNPQLRKQLITFLNGIERMWEEQGRYADVCGTGNLLKVLDPRHSRNIMVEEETNKIWLVDTSAHPLAFSKQAMITKKLQLKLLRRNSEKFLKKLIEKDASV